MKLRRPMLAAKPEPEDLDRLLPTLRYPLLGSPKYDGIRCSVQGGRLYSRSLKLIPNKAMQDLWGVEELEGLDGEICVGPPTAEDCFNRSTSVVMSQGKPADGAVFYVFDMPDDVEPFAIRLSNAGVLWDGLCHGSTVQVVRHALLKTDATLLKYEDKQTSAGHEGIMLRDPNGVHKQGRSTLKEGGLIAVKRFADSEAVVMAVNEQEENTNAQQVNELGKKRRSSHKAGMTGKGTLGSFTVRPMACACGACLRDKPPAACLRKFNIGATKGLTDADRLQLWRGRAGLPGKIIKFRHQVCGAKDRPRIPTFLGFRDEADI